VAVFRLAQSDVAKPAQRAQRAVTAPKHSSSAAYKPSAAKPVTATPPRKPASAAAAKPAAAAAAPAPANESEWESF
jgi:hypothetical protein